MRHKVLKFGVGFRVSFGNRRAQAAEMVLAPGDSEGDAENRHRGADQWLFVASGSGVAIVNGARVALKKGVMLLIEKGDRHEIRNNGRAPLRTLSIYTPPAYTRGGKRLPRGRSTPR